jgi:arylamine N-acetyltransferase
LIESVKGDDALRRFAAGVGLGRGALGIGFLNDLGFHFARLPYENISKIIKSTRHEDPRDAMRLPDEVVADHLERGFGGTCFSLTFLLERMLLARGFDCYKVMADMNSGPSSHCLVVVRERGSVYMLDPGYALNRPIELPPAGSSRVGCPHAVVTVRRAGGTYHLSTEDAGGSKWRYAFDDSPVADCEFERYWAGSFTRPTLRNICLTRMTPHGHIYLRKDFFKFTSRAAVDRRRIGAGIEAFVEANFGIKAEWTDMARQAVRARRCRAWQR